MRTVKYVLQFMFFLGIIVGGIFFGSENTEPIRIVVMGNLADPMPVWFVVLAAFFIGAALSGIYFSLELFRLWLKVRRMEKDRNSSTYSSKTTGSTGTGFRFSSPTSTPASPTSSPFDANKPRFTPFGAPPPPPRTFGSSTPGSSSGGDTER